MINNHIDSVENKKEEQRPAEKPNESSGIYVRGFLKISDPESGETVLETAN